MTIATSTFRSSAVWARTRRWTAALPSSTAWRACTARKSGRAGAAVVIAGLGATGETVVTDIRFIERGYENFVGKLRSIGADIVLERDGAEQCAAAAAE